MRIVVWCAALFLLCACTGTASSPHADRESPAAVTSSAQSGSPSDAGTSPAVRLPPPPRTGACYRLSFADATRPTNRKTAVPCAKDHTAVTIYVGKLDLVVGGHALGVDSDRAQRQVTSTCTSKLPAYLGGSTQDRQLSRFQVIWFSPTLRQSDAGADWFRCDLVAVGTGEQLMRLPHRDALRHVLDRPRALATFGLCGTAQPGSAGFDRVPCGTKHSWVAVGTIPLSGGNHYPGAAAVRKAGDQACADAVRRRNGLALKFQYGWEWPTAAQWANGQHYGYCWSPGK